MFNKTLLEKWLWRLISPKHAFGRLHWNRNMGLGGWQIQLHWLEMGINLDGGMTSWKQASQIKEAVGLFKIWFASRFEGGVQILGRRMVW